MSATTIEIKSKSYSIVLDKKKDNLNIMIFKNEKSFIRHCKDHFFSQKEPWDRVLSRSLLKAARKKLVTENVISKELYEAIIQVADDGIQFSLDLPLYVHARQTIENIDIQRDSIYCIAADGYVIVMDKGCLRTMYFSTALGKNPSKHILFQNAWKDIKRKLSRPHYVDSKMGSPIYTQACDWISPGNWKVCPNPHLRPAVCARSAMPQWWITHKKQYRGVIFND